MAIIIPRPSVGEACEKGGYGYPMTGGWYGDFRAHSQVVAAVARVVLEALAVADLVVVAQVADGKD